MDFIKLLVTAFAQSITSFYFIIIILLAYFHLKSNTQLEESWIGISREAISNKLMGVVLCGMIIGLLASFIIVILGITLDLSAILVIWPLALILMLFNKRYICFSYAGGIVSITALIFGWPRLDVSAVIALVGVLHLMESMLIIIDGHRGTIPVVVRNEEHKPVGAFLMRKLWPIPIVMLVIPNNIIEMASGGVSMPQWWPLFKPESGVENFMLFPLFAILGYSDLARTQPPRARTRESGFWLCVYSIVILILAVISSRIYWMKYIAAIATPLLHEILILAGRNDQMQGKPAFGAPWRGLRILEILPESVGEHMGLMPGDVLLSINGKNINSEKMLNEILRNYPTYIWIDVKRSKDIKTLEYKDYKDGIGNLGVFFVPRQTGKFFIEDDDKGIIIRFISRLSNKRNNDIPPGSA